MPTIVTLAAAKPDCPRFVMRSVMERLPAAATRPPSKGPSYGEREIATLEENCMVKQWFKVSNFEEAERLSKAMGEAVSVSHSLGLSSEQPSLSATLNTGRQRLFTPYELMSLPDDEQILHVAGARTGPSGP